jgi:predicted metalloprotease with PDZ domain
MKLITILVLCGLPLFTVANDGNPRYDYIIDLENIVGDKVYVELLTPEINKKTIRFYLPKVVPGTYSIYDFGRFVSKFRAEDAYGNALPVELGDINTYIIQDAKKLHKVSYWVDDTFDDTNGVHVSGMSGTNIEAGKDVVLNGHGFFGYFEGMKEMPFQLTVKKQADFYGATAMIATYPDANTEVFNVSSYNTLVDMPILYCKPDTTTIRVGDSDVLIAVSSPTGNVTSAFIAEHFADVLEAERKYMGGTLLVNKYAFLMYFLGPGKQIGMGALEHNYSSLYVLPDIPQERFIQPMKDIAAHEFFHIITPLNVHAEQIRLFDFNDPQMSRHLWMYEGVTEYFSHHAQLVHGVTNMDYFLNQMQEKISTSLRAFDDALPFTRMSAECLSKYQGQYGNVYEKGALIGLCLDVILRQESNGEMGLMDLMLALKDKFGANTPFKDKKLFNEIGDLSTPAVKKFLKKYVNGKSPLPLQDIFNTIGVAYTPPGNTKQFTYGNISLSYNADNNRVAITSVSGMNEFGRVMGYQAGDEIVSINGEKFNPEQPMALFHAEREKFVEGEKLVVEVVRTDAQGKEKSVLLIAPIQTIDVPGEASLVPMKNLSVTQKEFQAKWTQGAKHHMSERS